VVGGHTTGTGVQNPETAVKQPAVYVFVLVLAAGCDGHTSLSGEVVGPDDKPIAGVKVRLSEPKEPSRGWDSTTDEAGRYSVALTHAPFDIPLVVTATKEGYKPYQKEFKVSQRAGFPKRIVLEPAQASGAAENAPR
jgi:hypothetical protein